MDKQSLLRAYIESQRPYSLNECHVSVLSEYVMDIEELKETIRHSTYTDDTSFSFSRLGFGGICSIMDMRDIVPSFEYVNKQGWSSERFSAEAMHNLLEDVDSLNKLLAIANTPKYLLKRLNRERKSEYSRYKWEGRIAILMDDSLFHSYRKCVQKYRFSIFEGIRDCKLRTYVSMWDHVSFSHAPAVSAGAWNVQT